MVVVLGSEIDEALDRLYMLCPPEYNRLQDIARERYVTTAKLSWLHAIDSVILDFLKGVL